MSYFVPAHFLRNKVYLIIEICFLINSSVDYLNFRIIAFKAFHGILLLCFYADNAFPKAISRIYNPNCTACFYNVEQQLCNVSSNCLYTISIIAHLIAIQTSKQYGIFIAYMCILYMNTGSQQANPLWYRMYNCQGNY